MKPSKDFIFKILNDQKYELLGKLMKRYEVIYGYSSLNDKQRKDLFRELIKELIHENFRDLKVRLDCYLQGSKHFKVDIQRPISK